MNETLEHRGPDMKGLWVEPSGRVALAFSRLAIQDLSPDANQPMMSREGTHVLVFNGEIYNTDELREWLGLSRGYFRTNSDTEVLLQCLEHFGVAPTLTRANGMFAFALYSILDQKLFLGCDRLGKKPLHYTVERNSFRFASELKALLAADTTPRAIDEQAVERYFGLSYIPVPGTIFVGIHKLRPGSFLEVSKDFTCRESLYWRICDTVTTGRAERRLTHHSAVDQVAALIDDTVRVRLIGDVPIGTLLSGGVDSTLVANAIAVRHAVPLQTFTIGLESEALNELEQAKAIAGALRLPHLSLLMKKSHALEWTSEVTRYLDEPFGDCSALPTFAACRLARPHATVLLTGEGGDEGFGGYSRHLWSTGWRAYAARAYACLRTKRVVTDTRDTAVEIYRRTMTLGAGMGSMSRDAFEHVLDDVGVVAPPRSVAMSVLDWLRLIDLYLYLPNDILVKADRMSMANSVEIRSPLLDYRLIELSWRLSDDSLVHKEIRKRVLCDIFSDRLGSRFLQGRKYGFSLPIADWLAGPLREDLAAALRFCSRNPITAKYTNILDLPSRRASQGYTVEAHRLWLAYSFWCWARVWANRAPARNAA